MRNHLLKMKDSRRDLVIHFQSTKVSESDPDIVIERETWLHQGKFERDNIPTGEGHTLESTRRCYHHSQREYPCLRDNSWHNYIHIIIIVT